MQNIFRKKLTFLIILITGYAHAAPQETLQTADSLFKAGRYIQAFEHYEQLMVQEKLYSPAMLLKMALIKEGLGQIDQALYYLNIYYLETIDDNALTKMEELANTNDLAGYNSGDVEWFKSLYYRYYYELTFLLLALMLFAFAMIIYQKRKGVEKPMGAAFAFFLLIALLFYQINFGKQYDMGIISHESTYVMSGPSSGAKVVEILDAGHRVEIKGYQDVWTKIEWDGQRAYVKNKNLRPIRFL